MQIDRKKTLNQEEVDSTCTLESYRVYGNIRILFGKKCADLG